MYVNRWKIVVLCFLVATLKLEAGSLYVVIGIDTENYVEAFAQGEYQQSNFSEALSIEGVLSNHGIKGTFFVDVLEWYRIGAEARVVTRTLHSLGHDIQLHVHPIWAADKYNLWEYSLVDQLRIIGDGVRLLKSWTGKRPVAFRAGAYSANRETLRALEILSIKVDCSQYFQNQLCKLDFEEKNRVFEYEGVIEFPVSGYWRKCFHKTYFRKADINHSSLEELVSFIRQSKNNLKVVHLFLHSWSFIKDNDAEEKLKKLISYCQEDGEIEFITMTDFYERYLNDGFDTADYVPYYRESVSETFKRRFRLDVANYLVIVIIAGTLVYITVKKLKRGQVR